MIRRFWRFYPLLTYFKKTDGAIFYSIRKQKYRTTISPICCKNIYKNHNIDPKLGEFMPIGNVCIVTLIWGVKIINICLPKNLQIYVIDRRWTTSWRPWTPALSPCASRPSSEAADLESGKEQGTILFFKKSRTQLKNRAEHNLFFKKSRIQLF
jgi:hypothetical protein